ncbi:TolC family protein [Mucilaginibacter paludis]|uniref:Outer membrane efflux protein n=1 Tax=Mucilaginibacter paludis DSM 18603 TaxID=714943 RepID=H1YD33_9SPHI|nr:TolC family protein [Mucilaginibacter paludis]EHQ26090.1 outer membrane efflux protein [Mucilaginibacter paludis DSM 18603]
MISSKYWIKVVTALLAGTHVLTTPVLAQDSTRTLTLNDAIQSMLKNNKSVQLSKLDVNIATAKYRQTDAVFLPQADLSYTAMGTNNPLSAFGFKLEQRRILQSDFNPDLLNHPSTTPDLMAKLEVQQPLLNIDMLYMRKGAQKQTEVYQYKVQRTEEYITFEVQKAYLQLQLAYQAVKVLTEARQTANAVYVFADNHFKQGLIQKSDLLNAQVNVTTVESNLAKAKSSIGNASDYLGFLMGVPAGIIYQVVDDPGTTPLTVDSARQTFATRSDFMAMEKAIEASGLMIKSSQMTYLPKLNAFGNYQYNNSNLTGLGAGAYLFGVQLSWKVFNGNKTRHVVEEQKLERDKLAAQLVQQKEEGEVELNKAYRDLADARFEIAQAQASVQQSSEALRILQNRYLQGLVNTTDILTAGAQLSQIKFLLAQAQFTANVTRAYIQLLTSTTTK